MSQWDKSKTLPKELPLWPGPKLNLFKHHDSPIEWIERLGEYDWRPPYEGYVFRARIRNREYAIKVCQSLDTHDYAIAFQFRFFDPTANPEHYRLILADPTLDNIAHYDDPFYNECRAYGRINEYIKKKKSPSLSNIAAPCHGFFFLRPRDTHELERDYHLNVGYGEINVDYQDSTVGGLRPRAIVKDLAPDLYEYWDGKMLNTMLRGILRLNRHGILNRDIKADNYVGTQLVDFGRAATMPDLIFDHLPNWQKPSELHVDLIRFHEMVENLFNDNFITAEDVRAIRHPMARRSDPDTSSGDLLKLLEDNQDDQDDGGSTED
ncbi:unnamed protein product [Clonostachys solani]|uniref:Protein kinase domain-containing protein n=1 Tax=Clonostachys solani TaxID=160281 RepID=A0A9P0END4_9HYPO|nr:unnamed protein product [Clonostachys solani]